MTKQQANAGDWDDWEDDSGVRETPPAAAARVPLSPLTAGAPFVAGAFPELSTEADEDENDDTTSWIWNLKHMEKDLLNLPPLSHKANSSGEDSVDPSPYSAQGDATEGDDSAQFERILTVAEEASSSIHFGRERIVTLEALALVTKLHLLSVRRGFHVELQSRDAELEVPKIVGRLHKIAGDWGVAASLSDEIPDPERQQIHEMSSLLHNALASCDGDISPFQQVIEQLFASLPGHRFKISVNWIRSSSTTAAVVKSSDFSMDPLLRESTYLQHLQDLSDPSAAPERVVAVLTEAEVFQDSKDIKRDELIINGEYVAGTVGYSAIVDSLQRQIHGVLKEQVGKQDVVVAGDQPHAFTETTRDIAKQILNACNRTESGGSSYEILGKFLSNHEMDTVLIRPDSAKATPLEIHLDVGAFLEKSSSSSNGEGSGEMWAFGVRAVLSAVTWYLVCDAEDPTSELYEVKTTYQNRLAFPLALTPFHPLNSMRKDCGSVEIEFMLPNKSSPPASLRSSGSMVYTDEANERRQVDQEADLDLDELL